MNLGEFLPLKRAWFGLDIGAMTDFFTSGFESNCKESANIRSVQMGIAGTLTHDGTFDERSLEKNTLEYNGGLGGYEVLILGGSSGSVTKTMPKESHFFLIQEYDLLIPNHKNK